MSNFDFPENGVVVCVVSSEEALELAYRVRLEVFVEEQKVPLAEEIDALDVDPTTTHVLARDAHSGEVMGTARLLPTAGNVGHFHIGRVAVKSSFRGRKVGAALMSSLEQVALAQCKEHGVPAVVELSAQIQASGFYQRLGYSQSSEHQYLDAGILHVDMVKTIPV